MEKTLGIQPETKACGVLLASSLPALREKKFYTPSTPELKIIETVPKEEGIFSRGIQWSDKLAPGLDLYRADTDTVRVGPGGRGCKLIVREREECSEPKEREEMKK